MLEPVHRLLSTTLFVLLLFPLALLSQTGAPATGFALTTNAFPQGGDIPEKYTCSGANVSPALRWSNVPAAARSLALIVDDPDAPSGTFTHWVLYNLDPGVKDLQEGIPTSDQLPNGALQGTNSAHATGYHGPCPPPGKPHRYFFKLYALDSRLELKPDASRSELESAMQGHVLAQAETMGRFKR